MSINIDQWHAGIGSLIQNIGTVRTGGTTSMHKIFETNSSFQAK